MFRYIDTPFIGYNQYRPIISYRPRYVRRSNSNYEFYNFLQQMNTIEQMERIAEKNALYNLYLLDQAYRKSNHKAQGSQEEEKPNTIEDSDNQAAKENKEEKQEINTSNQKKNIRPQHIYYSEIRSKYCDGKSFEEKREVIEDQEGFIHHKQIRKIGDRWYEQEKITNQSGEMSSEERWHNISEEEIAQFKEEWYSQSGFVDNSKHQEALTSKDNNNTNEQDVINIKDESSPGHLKEEESPIPENNNDVKDSEKQENENISNESIDNSKETQTEFDNSTSNDTEPNSIPNNQNTDKIE